MKDVMNALFRFSITIRKEFKINGESSEYDVKVGWFWVFLAILFLLTNI